MPVVTTETFGDIALAVELFYARPQEGRRLRVVPDAPLDAAGFADFCEAYPEAVAELEPDGSVTLISPLTLLSDKNEQVPFGELRDWHKRTGLGEVFSSTAGFRLPDGSVRSPDAAWVSQERLAALSEADYDTQAQVVPDFVIEVMSKGDKRSAAQSKMRLDWLANGVRLGWLLWPERRRAYVYRAGVTEPEELRGYGQTLQADSVVPGFAFDLSLLLQTGLSRP